MQQMRALAPTALFGVGFLGGLLGDSFHVQTGTTEYFARAHAVPFLALSPLWFPFATGLATVAIGLTRARLRPIRTTIDARRVVAGIAAVLGLYALTAAIHSQPEALSITLVTGIAVIIWCVMGDRTSLPFAAAAAVFGPLAEITLAHTGVFRYAADTDGLFGVAPWLPALYFAFGVVASMLGEFFAAAQISVAAGAAGRVPAPTR